MRSLFSDFTNQYPVSKTLRFELIPQGKTKEFLEKNGVLENDEERSINYTLLKGIMDEYYKAYIDDTLSCTHLEGLEEYARLYMISAKEPEEVTAFRDIQQSLRDQIVVFLTSDKRYANLFKGSLITEELPKFFIKDEEKLGIIRSFDRFTSMCTGFWKNRKNLFTAEEKSSAIAYRVVNDNLPRFMNNLKVYDAQIDGTIHVPEDLMKKLGLKSIEQVFTLDYFDKTVSQSGIDVYNTVIGGYSEDEHTKVPGLNELINLHNQKNPSAKIPLLQPLYKQILSDSKSLSFTMSVFDEDNEVIRANKLLFDEFRENILGEDGIINNLLCKIKEYRTDGIFVRNSDITEFSRLLYGNWRKITTAFNTWYDAEYPRKGKSEDRYIEARKKHFNRISSFSLAYIEGKGLSGLLSLYIEQLNGRADAVMNAYRKAEVLLNREYKSSDNLVSDGEAIEQIKNLLDSMKDLSSVIRLLKGTGEEPNRDDLFYGEYDKYSKLLNHLDSVYSKTRNYLTKKPYRTEKIKLFFDTPSLLNGWDRNNESTNKSVILIKDGYYYLGIMNKSARNVFKNAKVVDPNEEACYRKMDYKLLPGPNKMLPKVFFAKSNIEYYAPSDELLAKYKEGTHKKGKKFNLQDCHALIDFFKESIAKNPDWCEFGFKFSDTETYNDISEFYKEVADQGYNVKFKDISAEYIDGLVQDGQLYLFKIYSKDFSPHSKGTPSLYTLYWNAVFSEKNLSMDKPMYKLNGEAEVFYRKKSIPENRRVIHKANEPIRQRRSPDGTSTYVYDIIKDRRYTVDKFQFHVPITINFAAPRGDRMNVKVRNAIRSCDDMHIIGINRGERNLVYVSVIDLEGNIKEQFSLNRISGGSTDSSSSNPSYATDYYQLLKNREADRADARKQWMSIKNIKALKTGYMSQVVHIIVKLMIKYNAILVMEDLSIEFKRSRQKIERQVYQAFEKAIIDKLNFLVDKSASEEELTGLFNALQLTEKFESFKKTGKQNGVIFYVNPWNTAQIDPTTGFVNMFRPVYENVRKTKDFISKFDKICFCEDDKYGKYLTFTFDYKNFTNRADGTQTQWTVCAYGNRSYTKKIMGGTPITTNVDLVNDFTELFSQFKIATDDINVDLKEQMLSQDSAEFYRTFMHLFRLTVQLQNKSVTGGNDYILSPVKNSNNTFFDSTKASENLPENVDANGAFNIARKGLYLVRSIKNTTEDNWVNSNLRIPNEDWLNFIQ